MRILFSLAAALLLSHAVLANDEPARKALIGDLTTIEGVRENALIGYGMVVGLTSPATASKPFHHPDAGQHHAAHGRADSAGDRPGEKRGRRVCDRQPAAVRPSRHRGRRHGLFDRRCQEPGRRPAAADSALRRRRKGVCGGARSDCSGRIRRRRRRDEQADESPDRRKEYPRAAGSNAVWLSTSTG